MESLSLIDSDVEPLSDPDSESDTLPSLIDSDAESDPLSNPESDTLPSLRSEERRVGKECRL